MATTIKQTEATPATWPAVPTGLSTAAAAIPAAVIWGRIEGWVAHRWSARAVVWLVEGCGLWEAPLAPATLDTVEVWDGGAWADCTPGASPWGGYDLPGAGPYRITATVGAGPVPAAASEAYRRLSEYLAEAGDYSMFKGRAGASSVDVKIGDGVSQSFDRSPAWAARAMHYSGAADLLRPWRIA